jgi:hypothetical protein
LRRRFAKIILLALISAVAAVAIVGAAFFWRLSRGPVTLAFLKPTIEAEINKNFTGLSVKLDGIVIERDAGSGVPHLRLQNVVLEDASGAMLARAPRAAIGIDERALFRASIVPTTLELIGPRILAKRNLDGSIELGFGSRAAAADEVVALDVAPTDDGKADRQVPAAEVVPAEAGSIIDILAGTGPQSALSSLGDIKVTEASIQLLDEANDATWYAPDADLQFKRTAYGFVVLGQARIASGGEPWRVEAAITYRKEQRSYSLSASIFDLVPANVSDEIFALAQFAKVKLPLSGHAEAELDEKGRVTRASAEFAAAAGEVGLPDYLAQPIIVDEGTLRANYDPATGGAVISESSLLVGGSRAQISGRVDPVRAADNRLEAIKIELAARNVDLDTQGTVKDAVAVDRIDFSGRAAVEEARLEIDDLIVMSGNAGVRLRGQVTGGSESTGIKIGGRVRDVNAALLKKLWPPIIAPKTRKWVNDNVIAGRVTDGEFRVDIAPDELAASLRARKLADTAIEFRFGLEDVTTTYFKSLPAIQNADGTAVLTGDSFSIDINRGEVRMPSGQGISVQSGSVRMTRLLAAETLGDFAFKVKSQAQALLEYANWPDLKLVDSTGLDASRLSGATVAEIRLVMPLIKALPRERVQVTVTADITGAEFKRIAGNIDLSDGDVKLTVGQEGTSLAGTAKLNGIPANITWKKGKGKGAIQSATLTAKLDDKQREKLGVRLGDLLRGPVKVSVDIPNIADPESSMKVKADLSEAELRVPAINWQRPPGPATATFEYFGKGENGRRIENLKIDGEGVSVAGNIELDPKNSLRSATLTDVRLGDENRFAMTIRPVEGGTSIAIRGNRFDARPLIKSSFGGTTGSSAQAQTAKPSGTLFVEVNVDRVYAHRGEVFVGVNGTVTTSGGKVTRADLRGAFINGQPVTLQLVQVDGGRELRITGSDGGGALRAANLYSKIAGGEITFYALIANDANSSIRRGILTMKNFEVRNEAALAELDKKGKPRKSGPRKGGISFRRLNLPFTTDARFIRLGDTLIKGNDLGATAEGLIRKSDGAMDITGTIIPVYGLNSALSDIPLVGDILTGGKGQGIFGLTYALGGTINKPSFQVNPVSAIAPGIFRKLFEYSGPGSTPKPRLGEGKDG